MQAKQLYILPFDHRATFVRDLFGYEEPLSKKQQTEVSQYKEIIWKAFLQVYRKSKDKKSLGILIDEQFGSKIIKQAKKLGVKIAVAAEKSGQKVFGFEYGAEFGKHILKIKPDYSKVLVRYNPENNNSLQRIKLRLISDFCRENKIGFLFELLVPPTEMQSKIKDYDSKLRPQLTSRAIMQIRAFGIEPDIWKLEAMPDKKDWQGIIEAIKYQNSKRAQIIVLGRAGSKSQVAKWLKTASEFPEVIGFAVGRTIFFKPLKDFHDKKITKNKAIGIIAGEFGYFVNFWKKLRK